MKTRTITFGHNKWPAVQKFVRLLRAKKIRYAIEINPNKNWVITIKE